MLAGVGYSVRSYLPLYDVICSEKQALAASRGKETTNLRFSSKLLCFSTTGGIEALFLTWCRPTVMPEAPG